MSHLPPQHQLVCLALAHLDDVACLAARARLLRAAVPLLPDEIAARCEIAAAAIETAEAAQMELRELLTA
jgi:hypothetical protein